MSGFEEFAEQILLAATSEDLRTVYASAIEAEGYETLLFTSLRGREIDRLHWLQPTDGDPARDLRRSLRQIDPILAYAWQTRRPFLWTKATDRPELTKVRIVLLDESEHANIHSSMTFPFHGPGNQLDILNISRRSFEPTSQARLHYLHWISCQTWARFLEVTRDIPFSEPQDINLTAREMEVLRWSKDGKSYQEIAEILSISRKTVEFHMRNTMTKIGANNKVSAVVMAIHRGLIDI